MKSVAKVLYNLEYIFLPTGLEQKPKAYKYSGRKFLKIL